MAWITKAGDIPPGEHWAILKSVGIRIPGDERSRSAPGHGYPERTEYFLSYRAFTNYEEFRAELLRDLEKRESVKGIHVVGTYVSRATIDLETE